MRSSRSRKPFLVHDDIDDDDDDDDDDDYEEEDDDDDDDAASDPRAYECYVCKGDTTMARLTHDAKVHG